MKKQVLIPLLISLFAVTAWADVSVTERFSQVGEILNSNVSKTEIRTVNGDLCQWEYKGNRRDTTTSGFSDKLASGKLAWWTSGNNSDNLLRTKDAFEGGVKHIDLEWKQSTTADGATVIVDVIVGSTTFHPINYVGGNASTTVATTDQHASFDCNIKGNSQISITNLSTTTSKAGRILIGDITITPYLLYTQKKAFIGLSKTGYVNTNLIDNTDEEGNITYSIHDKDAETQNVAEINSSTGEITPLAVGKAVVTATWSAGATTSYELIVANTLVETFSSVSQTKSSGTAGANWTGSVCNWTNKFARRGTDDQINSEQASWLTLDGNTRGFLRTTNLEGGLLGVTFDYAQFGAESGKVIKWQVSDGTNVYIVERDGDLGANKNSPDFCSCIFENHQNAQLEILNASVMDDGTQPANNARLLIHNIAIAPYLLYTTKTHELYVGASYTNSGLINNTESGTITYSLEDNDGEASIDPTSGEVTALAAGEVTVKATWSEGAFTTYTLTILSKVVTEASYAESVKRVDLNTLAISNPLNYTDGYDGTITYSSSNTAVATVNQETGAVALKKGVGQATITATLPATENYEATSVSYTIYVRDESNARIEAFTGITGGVPSDGDIHDWGGDLFMWQRQYQVRRSGNDTIHAGAEKHQATSIGVSTSPATPSILQSKEPVEGGIKYLSFYWMQWGAASNCTRRIVVYADGTKIGEQEHPNGTAGRSGDEFLLGINNAMKSNKQLIIKNESYKGTVETLADNNCRIVMDNIYITPYLRYTTKERTLDLRTATSCTYTPDVDNTESGSITYSLEDNDGEASIDTSTGEVTGIKAGQVTVKATWSEGAFVTYTLNIISITETEASYPNAEIHATMGEAIPANDLAYTDGYDGEISYASSVPAVADFVNGILTLKAPGQTKITATLPETSNYTEATASYILTVSYANYESFNPNVTTSTYAKPEENAQGDMCKWYAYIGGVQTPNYFSSNAITTRAQRTNESNQGYVKSAKLSGGISALAFNYSMMFADNDIENWDIHVYVNDRLVGQLTNEEGGDLEGINGRTLNPMRTKVITGIDEPGRFVIRFENHSTIKNGVAYTEGNKGRFAIDNVSWENYDGAIVLDEEEDNSAVLAVNSGSTQDVQITRAALKGGVWNTLCLPFALPVSTLGVVENGVQTLSGATLNGDELTIGFTTFTGETLVAGIPYLVKPASDINISDTYSDKQIASIASTVVSGPVTLQGIFSPIALQANDYSTLFVGTPDAAGNNLFYPSADGTLKGFRAYFKIADDVAPSAPLRRARFVINEQQVTTELDATGQQVEPLRKQIQNGQLIIIRDGVRYDVLGRKL